METAHARDGEAALTTWAARLRPSVAVFAILGVAVTVAASLYVLRNAAEAPEVNAIVRGIMALTALAVGLYLWQRQPHNLYGPVLAAGRVLSSRRWRWSSPRIPGRSRSVGRWVPWRSSTCLPGVDLPRRPARGEGCPGWLLAATVAASGVVWTAALVLAETLPAGGPFIPCFEACPDNAARAVEISPDPSKVLGLAYGAVCAGTGLAAAAVLLRRLRAATPIRRRAIGPVLVVIPPVCIGTGAFIFVRQVAPDSPLLDPLGGLILGAFVLFPFMICVGLIRGRVLAASALAELVERLGRERSPAGVEEAMRAALRDPALELLFWSSQQVELRRRSRWRRPPSRRRWRPIGDEDRSRSRNTSRRSSTTRPSTATRARSERLPPPR